MRDSPSNDFENIHNQDLDKDFDDFDISPQDIVNANYKYYEAGELKTLSDELKSSRSYFHINCEGLVVHWDTFYLLIRDMDTETFAFDYWTQ